MARISFPFTLIIALHSIVLLSLLRLMERRYYEVRYLMIPWAKVLSLLESIALRYFDSIPLIQQTESSSPSEEWQMFRYFRYDRYINISLNPCYFYLIKHLASFLSLLRFISPWINLSRCFVVIVMFVVIGVTSNCSNVDTKEPGTFPLLFSRCRILCRNIDHPCRVEIYG